MYQNDPPVNSCTKTNPLCRNVPKRRVPVTVVGEYRCTLALFRGISIEGEVTFKEFGKRFLETESLRGRFFLQLGLPN